MSKSLLNIYYCETLDKIDSYEEYFSSIVDTLDTQQWKKALRTDNRYGYESYLDKYANGIYKDEAQKKIDGFIKAEAKEADKRSWEKAKKKNSKKSYEKYLISYYNGLYSDEAKRKVDEFIRLEKEEQRLAIEKENEAWELVCKKNTKEDYENYLKFYPNGEFKKQAKKNINKIINEKDYEAWRVAIQKNTVKEYAQYTIDFPNGMHIEEAEFLASEISNFKYSKNRFFLFYNQINGKYGVKDENHNIIISGEYSPSIKIEPYGIRVEKYKDGLYSFDGNIILEVKYDWIKPVYIGSLKEYRFILNLNGKHGVANNKGKIIIDILYEEIEIDIRDFDDNDNFNEKEKIIYLRNKNKSALYDLNGNMILDFVYDFYDPPYSKYGNCLQVKPKLYLNIKNKKILDFRLHKKVEYLKPSPLQKIGFFAIIDKNKKMGFTDENGKVLIQQELDLWVNKENIYDSISINFTNKFWSQKYIKKNGKYGIIDNDFKYILPPVYDAFYTGEKEIKYGTQDSKHYNALNYIDIIQQNDKYGLFHYNLGIVLDTKYDAIFKFNDVDNFSMYSDYIISKDGFSGACNGKGEIILDVEYKFYNYCGYELILKNKNIYLPLNDSHYMVEKNNKFGLYSVKLQQLILNPVYDKFDYFSPSEVDGDIENIVIKIGNRKGSINGSGYWLKPLSVWNSFIGFN